MSATDLLVRVAELQAARGDVVLVTLGLGSCVAIMLSDSAARVGGLAHILLPSKSLSRDDDNPGRFPQSAIPTLVDRMAELGADRRRITARLVGGAAMFASLAPAGSIQMGDRNLIAAREVLTGLAIPIIGEVVGGSQGRSVWFEVASDRIRVQSVGKSEHLL